MLTKLYSYFALLFLFLSSSLFAQVRIITFHCNRPEHLEYQCQLLKKFILDDFEMIVFIDAIKAPDQLNLKKMCEKYGVRSVIFNQKWHATHPLNKKIRDDLSSSSDANYYFRIPCVNGELDMKKISSQVSFRHSRLIHDSLNQFGYDHDDLVVIMDGDLFPIQPVSIRNLLKDVPLIGIDIDWPNAHWLWVPFIAFDPKRLPDIKDLKFHVGLIDGIVCDTGSASHEYLRNHPEVRYSLLPRCMGKDFFPYDEAAFAKKGLGALVNTPIDWATTEMEFYVDYRFLHFRGGSGLHPEIRHIELDYFMKKMLP